MDHSPDPDALSESYSSENLTLSGDMTSPALRHEPPNFSFSGSESADTATRGVSCQPKSPYGDVWSFGEARSQHKSQPRSTASGADDGEAVEESDGDGDGGDNDDDDDNYNDDSSEEDLDGQQEKEKKPSGRREDRRRSMFGFDAARHLINSPDCPRNRLGGSGFCHYHGQRTAERREQLIERSLQRGKPVRPARPRQLSRSTTTTETDQRFVAKWTDDR